MFWCLGFKGFWALVGFGFIKGLSVKGFGILGVKCVKSV